MRHHWVWTPALAVRGIALQWITAQQKGKVRVLRKSMTHQKVRVRQRLPSKKENAQSAIFRFCMKRQSRANDAGRRFPPSARTEEFSFNPELVEVADVSSNSGGKGCHDYLWYYNTTRVAAQARPSSSHA
jgi:hypothetical protein